MSEYPSDPQHQQSPPALRKMLAGYAAFNAWEAQEQSRALSHLNVEESLRQYFELFTLASALSDTDNPVFLQQNARHWAELRKRVQPLRSIAPHVQTPSGTG